MHNVFLSLFCIILFQELKFYTSFVHPYLFSHVQMTVTWTSGYNIDEAIPFVEWGLNGQNQRQSPAGTLTFQQNSMCGTKLIVMYLLV